MEINTVEDCFKFRLLRKINPDLKKSERSMEIAKQSLKEAENAIKLKIFQFAVLESYMAMFHSARALLYKDGIQEKSHFAVFVYLKELYSSKIPLHIINFLNIHRIERHETMYGLEYKPEKEDALTALEDAKVFVNQIVKISIKV
ncbi:MAG: HEPN domain-containing protein [Candidatus Pacearchaeota archaeon]|nr:HEPN domain-containing protein [Candidatus Pacearchaeota archaeon]